MYQSSEDPTDNGTPYELLQLADDTTILADNLPSLSRKVHNICTYSKNKYLEINYDKTKYMEMASNPKLDDLKITTDIIVQAVKPTTGYNWLGFTLSYANTVADLVQHNFATI